MAKGLLDSPDLDDRVWQDIVDEATSLIPYYNPEWTDHNRSDLGITLIELFAWLVEGMIYRLNRVPEKNFIEFLRLLGITRDPQTPATTLLTFRMAPAAPPLLLAPGQQVATPQTDTDPAIVFETDEAVQLLPINLRCALNIGVMGGVLHYADVTGQVSGAPLAGLAWDIPVGQSITLALGFDQASALPLGLRVALRAAAPPATLQVQFVYSRAALAPAGWPLIPAPLDGTAGFTQNGVASVTVPGDWAAQNPGTWPLMPLSFADAVSQPLFWVGLRVSNLVATIYTLQLDSVLFNAAHASSAITVTQPEPLGTSDGSAFQVLALKNVPLFKAPATMQPYAHLALQVRQPLVGGVFGPWTNWTQADEFPAGAANVYRLDPVTGNVSFGNFDALVSPDGHGSIPPRESEIQALTYRFVAGGDRANVPASTVNVVRTPAPGVIAATNPGPAANGADEESIDDAKRRGPEALRNRSRAVTAADYEYLAGEASTEVRKVRCLQPRQFTVYDQAFAAGVVPGDPWTYGGLNRDTGNVQVIIVPGGPLSNPTPSPSAELLQEVADDLEQRRTVTAALKVTGPRYLPIQVTAQIMVWKKAVDTGLVADPAASTAVRDGILARIDQFLHPVLGNVDGSGWEVGDDQTIAPLFEFIKPDSAVGFISALTIQALAPLYTPPVRLYPVGVAGVWVKFADYELVCSAGLRGPTAHVVTVTKI